MPQTGTHTMHYLFHVLGGIEVVWHHWESTKGTLADIELAKVMNWKEFVFVRTYRNPVATLEAYKSRAVTPEDGEKYFVECQAAFAVHNRDFPVPIAIEIDADNAMKTRNALEIFRRCEVEPPQAALDYMKSWKRINSHHDKQKPSRAIKMSIHKGRIGIWHTR